MKRTYQPKKRQRNKVHGFRKRMSTTGGRRTLARRRNKGRAKLSAQSVCPRKKLQKAYRLKSNSQYVYVYKKGSVLKNKTLTLIFVKNNSPTPKFGVNVTTKYGKAVRRNKLRRQIKSICIPLAKEADGGYYVFRPRFDAQNAPTFAVLQNDAQDLIKKSKLTVQPILKK